MADISIELRHHTEQALRDRFSPLETDQASLTVPIGTDEPVGDLSDAVIRTAYDRDIRRVRELLTRVTGSTSV